MAGPRLIGPTVKRDYASYQLDCLLRLPDSECCRQLIPSSPNHACKVQHLGQRRKHMEARSDPSQLRRKKRLRWIQLSTFGESQLDSLTAGQRDWQMKQVDSVYKEASRPPNLKTHHQHQQHQQPHQHTSPIPLSSILSCTQQS